jgi:hypothetical protein
VLGSLPINASNGIPQLDVNGKILVSQLPNSVMEYKGTWDAATNTPTLADGTGNQGDVYLCNVAGTVNFGSGPISFVVGDQVIYSGTIWQKASGASGTVTSVAVTESGDALSITGSPITTSGTINIGFAGTSAQYVAGDGSLITFPTLTGYVPYTGATANVNLGTFDLTADIITGAKGSFASSGGSDTFAINHSSGSGIALNITKGGNGEGLYINKTSGSGNAATIIGTLNATTLVKNGGTSSQFLKADGSVDSNTYITLASLSATTPLSYNNTTGAFSISQANTSTSGFLSSTDWNTFNNKQNALTNPITGTGVSGRIAYFNGTTTQTSSANLTWDNTNSIIGTTSVLATTDVAAYNLTINGTDIGKIQNITGQSWGLAYGTSGASNALGSSALVWNTTGNVIIINKLNVGNYNNTYNLDITGTARISGQLNLGSTITNGTFTYTLPGATGTLALSTDLSSYVPTSRTLTINGTTYDLSADRSWTIAAGISGSGTTNYVPKFTSGTAIGDSLIYDNGTNVGIGTASPTDKLVVSNAGANTLHFDVEYSGGASTIYSYNRSTSAYTNLQLSASNIIFQSGGTTERMRITSTGLVGIGTSTPTSARLQVSGSNSQIIGYFYNNSGSTGNVPGVIIEAGTNSSDYSLDARSSTGTSLLKVLGNGNVGIGTSSPSYKLDVQNSGDFDMRLRDTTLGGTVGLLFEATNDFSGTSQAYIKGILAGNSGLSDLIFGTAGTSGATTASERMRITSAGDLQLDSAQLNVPKTFLFYANSDTGGSFGNIKWKNVQWDGFTRAEIVVEGDGALSNGRMIFKTGSSGGNATEKMRITSGGDVCINATATSGSAKFYVNGGAAFGSVFVGSLGTGTVYSSSGTLTNTNPSDKRLKENIIPITYGLNEILKLNPVSFDWKNDNNKNKQFGFIAQEVQEVMPEAVIEGEYLGLEKDAIYTALINAIKELKAEIDELKNK